MRASMAETISCVTLYGEPPLCCTSCSTCSQLNAEENTFRACTYIGPSSDRKTEDQKNPRAPPASLQQMSVRPELWMKMPQELRLQLCAMLPVTPWCHLL